MCTRGDFWWFQGWCWFQVWCEGGAICGVVMQIRCFSGVGLLLGGFDGFCVDSGCVACSDFVSFLGVCVCYGVGIIPVCL